MNLVDEVSINQLYTIKLYLAQYDTNFEYDIQVISKLKKLGATHSYKLYKALWKRYEDELGTRRPKLKEEFKRHFKRFNDRKYLHDELHEHFAHYDKPLYKSILANNQTFYTSKKAFESLSEEDKFKCALEEIYVVATERSIFTHGYGPVEAKLNAMRKLIVGLTKGYFNIYLLANYFELLYSDNGYFETKLLELGNYEY